MARVHTATLTGVGSTTWYKLNQMVAPFGLTVQVGITSGSATYQVEVTLDEVDSSVATIGSNITGTPSAFVAPVALLMPGSASATADGIFYTLAPASAVRVTITSGTGTIYARMLQAGVT